MKNRLNIIKCLIFILVGGLSVLFYIGPPPHLNVSTLSHFRTNQYAHARIERGV